MLSSHQTETSQQKAKDLASYSLSYLESLFATKKKYCIGAYIVSNLNNIFTAFTHVSLNKI